MRPEINTASTWWEVLDVSSRVSLDEVTVAYRTLAKQFHPDIWCDASPSARETADARMKRINAAFAQAQHDIVAREGRDAESQSAVGAGAAATHTARTGHEAHNRDSSKSNTASARRAAKAKPNKAGSESNSQRPAEVEGRWYLQTNDGQQYGPVDREELDAWVAEGRIDDTCQLLCDGWDQWRWADEVFPDLMEEEAIPIEMQCNICKKWFLVGERAN